MTPNPLALITPAFVALRDTILGVRKSSKDDLRTWFVTHVEPVDLVMRQIYDDYTTGFGTVLDLLRSGATPIQAVALLNGLRLEKVRDRAEVRATADALADARRRRLLGRGMGRDFYDLYIAIDKFAVAAAPEDHLSFYSDFIRDFERIIAANANPRDPQLYSITSPRNDPVADVVDRIDRCRHKLMPDAWGVYIRAYQQVRLACV